MQHGRDMEDLSSSLLIDDVVVQLHRLHRAIDTRTARECTTKLVWELRAEIQRHNGNVPHETRKRIASAARNAKALASDLRNLPSHMREETGFYLEPDVVPLPDAVPLTKWLEGLEAVSKSLERLSDLKADGEWSGEMCAVCAALELIEKLAPGIDRSQLPKTKDSPFYLIADYLWEAASGDAQDLKRYCDGVLQSARGSMVQISKKLIIGGSM
jgi:hypothetical protein